MGIFSRIAGLFRRKKKPLDDDILKNLPRPPAAAAGMPRSITGEAVAAENVRARMDLVLTQMDSLRVQYETLNERLASVEKMIKELYDMAKSS